jgi:hypothetical protein
MLERSLTPQEELSREIAQQTAEFLAKGGKITQVEHYDPARIRAAQKPLEPPPPKVAKIRNQKGAIDPTSLDAEREAEPGDQWTEEFEG